MLCISTLLFCVASVSANPGSSAHVYGDGFVKNGTIQLDSHGQSQFLNDLPQTLAQSVNSGLGASVSIKGEASSGVTVNPLDDHGNIPNQAYSGHSNAFSNGDAATGTLTNNDNSHSDNTNGLLVDGHTQITSNGTGVNVHNYASSGVAKDSATTTPWSTTQCQVATCVLGNYFCDRGCYVPDCTCVPGSIINVVPQPLPKTATGNRRKFLHRNSARTLKNAVRLLRHPRQRTGNDDHLTGGARNFARKRP